MKLREEILKEHSKAQCSRIVQWVGKDQKRFDELFSLFLNDEYRVVQRAGWPISYCVQKYPKFIQKHFAGLIKNLRKPNLHNAVKRNTVRLLQYTNVPEKFQGDIMDICFTYICTPEEAAAVKAFSLTVLQNLARQYPDIRNELKIIIEERWDYESVAFKSRAKKLLKELSS